MLAAGRVCHHGGMDLPPRLYVTRARPGRRLFSCVFALVACSGEPATTTESNATDTSTGDASTTGDGTTGTSDEPTTVAPTSADDTTAAPTTGPKPAVCGDGVVDEGEPCDDGNDEPDDGCTKKCERTGAVKWTFMYDGASEVDTFNDVAVDATGQIYLVGYTEDADKLAHAHILALDPAGKEVWSKQLDNPTGLGASLTAVALGDDGSLYVAGREAVDEMIGQATLFKLTPEGDEEWKFTAAAPVADFANIQDIFVGDGAIYSTGVEGLLEAGEQMVARRHDPDTGEALWTASAHPTGYLYAAGFGVVAGADEVVVVGVAQTKANVIYPLTAVYDPEGAELAVEVDDRDAGAWTDVQLAAGGDYVLAGRISENEEFFNYAVRRLGPDRAVKWTQTFDDDFLYDTALGVAVGPGDVIAAGGILTKQGQSGNSYVTRFDPDGAPVWSSLYNNATDLGDSASAVAFGPDFVVAAGSTFELGQDFNGWVRAYAIE